MVEEHLAMLIDLPPSPPPVSRAREICWQLATRHYENFTVLSRLIPHNMRDHVASLYAFCRAVDDIGDQAPGDRLSLLDRYENELVAAYDGTPCHPVLYFLQNTIDRFDLPQEPFLKLIQANRMDQTKSRYQNFDELLSYCDHSANPVGRLFLQIFGYKDEELFRLSDSTCTALQLTNFWQDVKRDLAMGRIYIPINDMQQFSVTESDLQQEHANLDVRNLIYFEVDRAREFFARGLPLIDHVQGRLRISIALFSRGGLAILDKIKKLDFDTLSTRPTLSRAKKARLILSTLISKRWQRWIRQ